MALRMNGRLTAVWCCLLLAPVWALTLFDRGIWTPDEPREADMAWRMAHQANRTIPVMAGVAFLEKPPLAYWAAGAFAGRFPDHDAALRVPNLLFACIVTAAITLLALTAAGNRAAWMAGLTFGTFALALQVTSWLATDAAMLAGVAGALLGLYRGIESSGRAKLYWYALMHAGLACAFLAKGPGAWLVPAAGVASLVVIERDWRTLRSWKFWAPSVISVGAIAAWIVATLRAPNGAHDLTVLLWENVAGRAMQMSGVAAAYSQGHRNYPLKYLLELPGYVAPWIFLVAAAVRRAWVRARAPDGRAWRFALCIWAIPFALLSVVTTARGIYAVPALIGLALLIGLWFAETGAMDRFDRAMLIATQWLVAVLAAVFVAAAVLIGTTQQEGSPHWGIFVTGAIVSIGALGWAIRSARRKNWTALFAATFAAYATAFTASAVVLFPVLDQWQDLGSMARQIDRDTAARPLVLLQPDETTLALVDRWATHHVGRWHVGSLDESAGRPPDWQTVASAAPDSQRPALLLLLPGKGDGPLFRQLREWGFKVPSPPDPVADAALARKLGLLIERVYELPQGRRYALLSVSPAGSEGRSHPTGT